MRTLIVTLSALAALLMQHGALGAVAEKSGKEVVESACIACHGNGINGAPRIGDSKAWSKRAAQGLTGLNANAIMGIRQIPAHGGNTRMFVVAMYHVIPYSAYKY